MEPLISGDLASRIAALSPERRALFERRIRQANAGTERHPAPVGLRGGAQEGIARIPRRADPSCAPLSSAQRRLWLLHQIDPGDVRYAMGEAFRVRGPLRVDVLRRALDGVIARHEVLRTVFVQGDGDVVQQILPRLAWPLVFEDVSARPNAIDSARDVITRTYEEPFDLTRGPLMRGAVVRVAPDDHWLVIAFHHIVFDGWSAPVFWEEVGAAYAAIEAGRAPTIVDPSVQYGDFAAWEAARTDGPEGARALAYWTARLRGLAELSLPIDGPALPGSRLMDLQQRTFDARTVQAAMALVEQERLTPFMLLAAATALVTGRVCGQQDVGIGVPISGRTHPDLDHAMGLFLNTVVLRFDCAETGDARAFVRQTRAAALEAFEHQDAPFERVIAAVRDGGGRLGTPPVLLNASHLPAVAPRLGALDVEPLPGVAGGAKAPLSLYATAGGRDWSIRAATPHGTFSASTVAVMLEQIEAVVSQLAEATDRPLRDVSLVTGSIRAWLPDPSHAIAVDHPTSVLERVLAVAAAHPENIALEGDGRAWTYVALLDDVAAGAERLRLAGVTAGDVVAVRMCRSPQFVLAMLSTWRAGGVLVTIDPALPAARQERMLEEAGASCLVEGERDPSSWCVTRRERGRLDAVASGLVEPRSDDLHAPHGAAEAGAASRAPAPAGVPAYVFFTSGSTGVPRAVLGTHEGLAHFLGWQGSAHGVGPGDRAAHLTGASFDVVLRDVLLALTTGATLSVPPASLAIASARVAAWLAERRITILHAVPSLARTWSEGVADAALPDLRCIFFAGEPLTSDLVARWRALAPKARIVNLYGPTETTLARCAYEVERERPGVQPVGRPLPDSQVLIVSDDGWRISGALEAGEIVIRTPFRTSGYLNAPGDQVRRFVENPWRRDPRDLCYRTGDRGRWRPDGTIEILGRLDDEVKIGGVRVNPAGTAAVLEQHPAIAQAVVGVVDRNGPRLAAWVVSSGPRPPVADLRAHCGVHLPAAAVPSLFTWLDRLPLTGNGKIDRRALPPPVAERAGDPPATPTEIRLAAIWSKVLRVSAITRDDDFFQLGGHSLAAAQVVTHIDEAWGTRLPLRAMFDSPRLRDLAARLDAATPVEISRVTRADRRAYRIDQPSTTEAGA